MSNMSYCRFENTYIALKDVYNHIDDNDLSEDEIKFRLRLIELCQRITNEQGEWEDSDLLAVVKTLLL